jgi:hypothetical protein
VQQQGVLTGRTFPQASAGERAAELEVTLATEQVGQVHSRDSSPARVRPVAEILYRTKLEQWQRRHGSRGQGELREIFGLCMQAREAMDLEGAARRAEVWAARRRFVYWKSPIILGTSTRYSYISMQLYNTIVVQYLTVYLEDAACLNLAPTASVPSTGHLSTGIT